MFSPKPAFQEMANPMLVKDDTESKLAIAKSIHSLLLNSKLSDVCFLVGELREKIYAHRLLLAAGSEVFELMFYGELKETNYEIEVPDLTAVGFRNMLKYFYTRNVQEIDLAEMPPTFVAANKYLVCDLIRDLADHITRSCLDVSNAFLIYDQLLQLAIDDPLVNDIKFRIQTGFSEACADDIFNQIDKNTLIDILKFNWLNIAEVKLLKACLRRTDSEVARRHSTADQASKRATFESIKHLIRFGDLSLSDFGSVKEIQNYLTIEETASVRLYLSQRSNPIQIDYRSPRRPPPEVKIIKDIEIGRLDAFSARSLTTVIRSNRRICITSITTFGFTNYITGLNFGVYKDKKPVSSDAKIVASPNQSYIIHLALLLEPNTPYELQFAFTFNSNHAYHQVLGISNKMTFNSDESGFEFKIEPNSLGYHCIKSIGFVSPE